MAFEYCFFEFDNWLLNIEFSRNKISKTIGFRSTSFHIQAYI